MCSQLRKLSLLLVGKEIKNLPTPTAKNVNDIESIFRKRIQ